MAGGLGSGIWFLPGICCPGWPPTGLAHAPETYKPFADWENLGMGPLFPELTDFLFFIAFLSAALSAFSKLFHHRYRTLTRPPGTLPQLPSLI